MATEFVKSVFKVEYQEACGVLDEPGYASPLKVHPIVVVSGSFNRTPLQFEVSRTFLRNILLSLLSALNEQLTQRYESADGVNVVVNVCQSEFPCKLTWFPIRGVSCE